MATYSEKVKFLETKFSKNNLYKYIFKGTSKHTDYIDRIVSGSKQLTRSQKYRITKLYNSIPKLNSIMAGKLYLDVNLNDVNIPYVETLYDELVENFNKLIKTVKEFKQDYILLGDSIYVSNTDPDDYQIVWYVYGFNSRLEFEKGIMPEVVKRMDASRENFLLFYVFETKHRTIIHVSQIGD